MNNIREVYGIGHKKANDLKRFYNIKTVRSLRLHVKKIPDIVTEAQRTGLKYHNRIVPAMSRREATKHVEFIKKHLPSSIIAGSYRRELKKVNDIDVLITGDLKKTVNILRKKKYIIAELGMGETKFTGIAKLPRTNSYRRLDIIKTTRQEKPFALLYFTGDFVQNINMRKKAKRMKYSLSQYGLKNIKTGKFVTGIKNEKDIFTFLKMKYKEPNERSHEYKK